MRSDLIYDARAAADVLRAYPNAVIEDASDYIHESRISVDLPEDVPTIDWYVFLLKTGWANESLNFQLSLVSGDKHKVITKAFLRHLMHKFLDQHREDFPTEQWDILRAILAKEIEEIPEWDKDFKIELKGSRVLITRPGERAQFLAEVGDHFYVADRYHQLAQEMADAM